MENLTTCPVCDKNAFQHFDEIEDYFLTHEKFQLVKCNACGFIFTNPRPMEQKLGKYYQSDEYYSHSKRKKGLISILYNSVKNYSLRKKYALISNIIPKGKLLDIGCATGEFLNYFKEKGWKTVGIEPAENPRNYAREQYNLDVRPEAEIDNLEGGSFDVITMWHVLEHVSDLDNRIQQIKRILSPNGILVIALPNYLAWDAAYYKKCWAGYDVPRHLYHFSPETISKLLIKYHINIFDIRPMKFDSFYVSLLSEKYKSGRPKYLNAFINGIKSNIAAKKNANNYSSIIYFANTQNI